MYEALLTVESRGGFDLDDIMAKILTCLSGKFEVKKTDHYSFGTSAFTCIYILAESHCIIHTYPEKNLYYLNLCSCSDMKDRDQVLKVCLNIVQSLGGVIKDRIVMKR